MERFNNVFFLAPCPEKIFAEKKMNSFIKAAAGKNLYLNAKEIAKKSFRRNFA